MKYKKNISIELLDEHEKVNIYSVLYEGEKFTEFEKFLSKFSGSHPKDIGTIMARLDRIVEDGVFERHFRYAGKCKDRTAELPSHFETSKLRLYCICVSPNILILGNGGIKKTRTYQEDELLNSFEKLLQQIDSEIKKREKIDIIQISHVTLSGNLSLSIMIE